MAETPTSQVPFAAGRTSLVGTPARIVSPAKQASEEMAVQAAKEQTLAARDQAERLALARHDVELQGTKVLEAARGEALKQTDPDAVVRVYEDSVGTQLVEMKQGLSNAEDVAAFEIQMDRHMSAHQLDLDSFQLKLRRDLRKANLIESEQVFLSMANTTNQATVELAKRKMRDRLEEDTRFGAVDPVRGQAMIESFEEQADLAFVGALAAEERYDLALAALASEKDTPDLSPASRQQATEQIKAMRSNAMFSQLSVRVDRGDPSILGFSGEEEIDALRRDGILNDTHWRQISNKQSDATRSFKTVESAAAGWRNFDLRGQALDLNAKNYEDMVDYGFAEYQRRNDDLGYDQAAVGFAQEYGLIAPDAWRSATSRIVHSDAETSAGAAELMTEMESHGGQRAWRAIQTKKPSRTATERYMLYKKYRWGTPYADVKGKRLDPDETSGLAGSRDGIQHPLLSPEDAMQRVIDFELRHTPGPAQERTRRRHELATRYGGQEGRSEALRAFNHVAGGFFDLPEEKVPPVILNSILASAVESMAQGRLDEDTAFLGAAMEEVITFGSDVSTFHGRTEVTRYPPDLALPPRRHPVSGKDVGHVPYYAELVLQLANRAATVLDDPLLQAIVDEKAQDLEFTTGKRHSLPPGARGSAGAIFVAIKGVDTRPTQKEIVEEWAERRDVVFERAWADYNAALWGQGEAQGGLAAGPGPLAWEPELEGDDVTVTGLLPSGERAPMSWLVVARTEDGAFVPLVHGGAPLGERIGFAGPVLNPVLRAQPWDKDPQQIIEVLEAGRQQRRELEALQSEGVRGAERAAGTTLPRPM